MDAQILWHMQEGRLTVSNFKTFLSKNCLFTSPCYRTIKDKGRVTLALLNFCRNITLSSVIEILLCLTSEFCVGSC